MTRRPAGLDRYATQRRQEMATTVRRVSATEHMAWLASQGRTR